MRQPKAARWNDEYRMQHDRLFEEADIVTIISHAYTKGCLFRRNKILICCSRCTTASPEARR